MNENIKVFLRIKPNIENLTHLKDEDCASYSINNNQLLLYDKKKNQINNKTDEIRTKKFFFNQIFDVKITQNEIFESIGKSLIDNFIDGYNTSILAYGNTNSGKTFTLYGGDKAYEKNKNIENKENNGLIYLCLNYLFSKDNLNKDIETYISVIEIYLEKIRDLGKIFNLLQLDKKNEEIINFYSNFHESALREDSKGNTYVENVTLLPVKNIVDVSKIINLCFKYRKTNITKKNLVSSRSHCLLTVYKYKYDKTLISQINFIDLAGSEKFTDIEMVNKDELININNTLSVLNRVIMAINTKNKITKNFNIKEKEKIKEKLLNVHIPYRDSKLTRLLKNSLDGNSFTYIFICLNINCYKIEDFINSLIFSKRCKIIRKKIKKHILKSNDISDILSDSNENTSFESCLSNDSIYNFLNKTKEIQCTENKYFKKLMKIKNLNHKNDLILNNLIDSISYIIKKKYDNLTKKKKSVTNNIIKLIKIEENNKKILEKYKNMYLKLLKQNRKELIKNEKIVKNIIYSKNKIDYIPIKKCEKYDSLEISFEDNKNNKKNENSIQNNDQNIINQLIFKNENEENIQEKNIQLSNTTKEKIQKIYEDINSLLQIEIQKINKKINIIEQLNAWNICLFKNINKLTNIMKNIYQNKYNTVVKHGKKCLNVSNYFYDEIKDSYTKEILKTIKTNSMDNNDYMNKNIIALYKKININEIIYNI